MTMRSEGVFVMDTWSDRASVLRCCSISCSCARRARCSATDSAVAGDAEKGRPAALDGKVMVCAFKCPSSLHHLALLR